jgi:hypothetical protein
MYTSLYVDSRPLAATFVAVTVSLFLGTKNASCTAQFSFSTASAHLLDGSASKTVMDRERIASLKLYISFPVNALDILP